MVRIASNDVGVHSNRKLIEFQVAAGGRSRRGIPLVVRALVATTDAAAADAAYVLFILTAYNSLNCSRMWYSSSHRDARDAVGPCAWFCCART